MQPKLKHTHRANWRPEQVGVIRADATPGLTWDHSTDLLVVGMGGAGATAAVRGLEHGLKVTALDRFDGGGSTAMNGGIYYAGGGTSVQKAAGVEDSVQAMYDYLKLETGGVVSDATLRRFCEQSVPTVQWLEQHGVQFKPTLYSKKTSYPPLDYYLYHSDSTLSGAYAAAVKPAARGHKVYSSYRSASALGFGKDLYEPLRNSALKQGLKLLTHFRVTQLVEDASGRIIGVQGTHYPEDAPQANWHRRWVRWSNRLLTLLPPHFPGGRLTMAMGRFAQRRAEALEQAYCVTRRIRAERGVCLSTGGFVFNRDWVMQVAPAFSCAMPLGNPGDDGSGIALGCSVGGVTDRMNHLSAWRFISPPSAFASAMLVDHEGQRIIDETNYGAAIGMAMAKSGGRNAWIIMDPALLATAKHQINHDGLLPFQRDPARLALMFCLVKADTLHGLAAKIGVPAEALQRTFAHYQSIARGEQTDPFGKRASDCATYSGKGPFYALDVSVNNRLLPLPSITLGGLKVDEETGQVLNAQGNGIAGLYAAGRTAVGICSHLYVSGLAAADCVFSGQRVADAVAAGVAKPLENAAA